MTVANGHLALVVDAQAESPADAMRAQARRLSAMADDLFALADALGEGEEHPSPAADSRDDNQWLVAAREAYRHRRLRAKAFDDPALFGEPAWDLLLDLYISAMEGKPVPVTSACIGAAVPTTTALRWLALLEERGLIARENDAADARRVFVRLTLGARQKMADYFARIAKGRKSEPATAARNPATEGVVPRFMLGNGAV